jgi:hypothetical protein
MRLQLWFALFLIFAYIVPVAAQYHHHHHYYDDDNNDYWLNEYSWMYFTGYMDDSRIYQTEGGLAGQKVVTGTKGNGTVSRTINAQVYAGDDDEDDYHHHHHHHHHYRDMTDIPMSFNEWGVYTFRPYQPSLVQSNLKNALCAKNYEVGSQISERYSDIRDLVKDTTINQGEYASVYGIDTEIKGSAKIGARAQQGPHEVATYVLGGTYIGNMNLHTNLEVGNPSVLTLPCP